MAGTRLLIMITHQPTRYLTLSFDDGYRTSSVKTAALIERFGLRADFNIVATFEERNPVLHGREPRYGDRKKAAALLFVVETLERQITSAFKEQMGKELMQRFGKSEGS